MLINPILAYAEQTYCRSVNNKRLSRSLTKKCKVENYLVKHIISVMYDLFQK